LQAALAWEPGQAADSQPSLTIQAPSLKELLSEENMGLGTQDYTVQEGDSFWSVAADYDTDVDTLIALNTDVQPETLQPGQKLKVVQAFHGLTYMVQPGDTLYDIASSHHLSPEQIREANAMGRDNTVKVGEMIFLPGARSRESTRNTVVSRSGTVRRESSPRTAATTAAAPAPAAPAPAPAAPAPAPSPKKSSGWIWPLDGGMYTSEFGWRGRDFHEGMDIAVPIGTVAVAAKGGTVEFAGWHGGYGYMVLIDHGDGTKSRYAHASALLVTAGTAVEQGQPVIKVGSTGNSTGPHLHFEIIVNGTPQDPRNYLP
jgi:murein DD-endopeptidase MepM/ murein hydrolase activator NlpD